MLLSIKRKVGERSLKSCSTECIGTVEISPYIRRASPRVSDWVDHVGFAVERFNIYTHLKGGNLNQLKKTLESKE
jgi:hypothetical protein